MKIILLPLLAVVLSCCAGCAGDKRKKSSVRMYEGDSSPSMRMFDEKPGYPLNTR